MEDETETNEIKRETREERKARLAEEEELQWQIDKLKIDELEIQYGDSNIAVLRVPYSPGLPVAIAMRTPKPIEMKRFRVQGLAGAKGSEINISNAVQASDDLGEICCVYPDKETLKQLKEARPGILGKMSKAAQGLADAHQEREGKD